MEEIKVGDLVRATTGSQYWSKGDLGKVVKVANLAPTYYDIDFRDLCNASVLEEGVWRVSGRDIEKVEDLVLKVGDIVTTRSKTTYWWEGDTARVIRVLGTSDLSGLTGYTVDFNGMHNPEVFGDGIWAVGGLEADFTKAQMYVVTGASPGELRDVGISYIGDHSSAYLVEGLTVIETTVSISRALEWTHDKPNATWVKDDLLAIKGTKAVEWPILATHKLGGNGLVVSFHRENAGVVVLQPQPNPLDISVGDKYMAIPGVLHDNWTRMKMVEDENE